MEPQEPAKIPFAQMLLQLIAKNSKDAAKGHLWVNLLAAKR